jgi:hypothetical protein
MKHALLALLLLVSAFASAQLAPISPREQSCGANIPRLMILGSFHMGNPGQDKFNMEIDDYLSAKRQAEVLQVLEKLARYQPTKIAVEGDFKTQAANVTYKKYLVGEYSAGRNEIEQFGMRLAKQLGHRQLYPIDFPMWMDGRVPAEIGTSKPRAEEAHGDKKEDTKKEDTKKDEKSEPPADMPAIYVESQRLQKNASTLDYLKFLNGERYMTADHAGYMSFLRPETNTDSLYGKSDALVNWYKRNFRIMTNINRAAEPGDRILLIIGAGHQTILRQLALDSSDLCLVDTLKVLE